MNEELVKMFLEQFKKQYSDLFETSTLGGIIKIEYQMEPEPTFFIEIGGKEWVSNIITSKFQGIKIHKYFVK